MTDSIAAHGMTRSGRCYAPEVTTEEKKKELNLGMQLPYRSKMFMREMMKYGYRLGIELGAKSDGITEPIEHNRQKGRVGIGYQPPKGKTRSVSSGKKVFVPEHVASSGQSSTPEDNIIYGMGKLFMNMIEESCEGIDIKKSTIRDAEPRKNCRIGQPVHLWLVSSLGSMELQKISFERARSIEACTVSVPFCHLPLVTLKMSPF
ncbi:hypothetical protein A4A49_03091 [Nicotiana attenuata]|uniref:G-patch domain-containing protein n=1 Tax=Nicotiana attenuata TaxID=49451 RepID=A0A1J6IF55_NICAT|nr:hypothetical protein A4A49_03091 [Nicotiana attenuata]